MKKLIKNGLVFMPDCKFEKKDILVNDECITEIDDEIEDVDAKVIDVSGNYVIPGLIDIHFHGCRKKDFCDGTEDAIRTLAEYEASCGVTAICPATMTFDEERLGRIVDAARDYQNNNGAILVGINMEGPFISPNKIGAQNPTYVQAPDRDMFLRLQKQSGNMVRLVDIAPEMKGALDFIKGVKSEVNVSIAHTAANYDTTMKAFEAGANHVTHLYNAMSGYSHREPGVVGASADYEGCFAELICDGVHIHPAVVRTTFKMFGKDRIVFISDSMEATGMEDGEYELGGQKVIKNGKRATLEDGTIAGSVTNLFDCMKNAVINMNIPLEEAIQCSTINPAKSVQIDDIMGSIQEGKLANIVIMSKDMNLQKVLIKGN